MLSLSAITAVTFLLSACSHTTVGASAPVPASDVRDILQRSVTAYARGDFATIESLWAHGEEASVFESGEANYGWPDYRDHHLKPELTEMKSVQYSLSDIAVRGDDATAWATFKYSFAADYQGRRVHGSGLGTAVLERRSDGWKIVHWHTSSPH